MGKFIAMRAPVHPRCPSRTTDAGSFCAAERKHVFGVWLLAWFSTESSISQGWSNTCMPQEHAAHLQAPTAGPQAVYIGSVHFVHLVGVALSSREEPESFVSKKK